MLARVIRTLCLALALGSVSGALGCQGKGTGTIFEASERGDLERVEQLVAADPSLLTARDRNGNSAAALAILHGHNQVAIALLEHGTPIDPASEAEPSLLIACVSRYSPESEAMLAYLLDHGADPNAFYAPEGWRPLHIAVNNGQLAKVRLLAAHGADLSALDGHGQTPLAIAEHKLASARDSSLRDPDEGGPDPDERRERVGAWLEMVATLRELGAG